jgi:hypothetical protein
MASSAAGAMAKPPERYGVMVYSSVCWEKESGDAAGYRITVRRLADGDDVIFEWSEGPLESALGEAKIDAKTSALTFSVAADAEEQGKREENVFKGRISDDDIVGVMYWAGGKVKWTMRLPRVRQFGQKTLECR